MSPAHLRRAVQTPESYSPFIDSSRTARERWTGCDASRFGRNAVALTIATVAEASLLRRFYCQRPIVVKLLALSPPADSESRVAAARQVPVTRHDVPCVVARASLSDDRNTATCRSWAVTRWSAAQGDNDSRGGTTATISSLA
jgi:hypothetical protein